MPGWDCRDGHASDPHTGSVRVATVNLASGRDAAGVALSTAELAAAIAELDADVVAVQEMDVGQPRSHGVDQPAVVAAALAAADWRFAATVLGTPAPEDLERIVVETRRLEEEKQQSQTPVDEKVTKTPTDKP